MLLQQIPRPKVSWVDFICSPGYPLSSWCLGGNSKWSSSGTWWTLLRMALPTVLRPPKTITKEKCRRHAHKLISSEQLLYWGYLFPCDSSLWQGVPFPALNRFFQALRRLKRPWVLATMNFNDLGGVIYLVLSSFFSWQPPLPPHFFFIPSSPF